MIRVSVHTETWITAHSTNHHIDHMLEATGHKLLRLAPGALHTMDAAGGRGGKAFHTAQGEEAHSEGVNFCRYTAQLVSRDGPNREVLPGPQLSATVDSLERHASSIDLNCAVGGRLAVR